MMVSDVVALIEKKQTTPETLSTHTRRHNDHSNCADEAVYDWA